MLKSWCRIFRGSSILSLFASISGHLKTSTFQWSKIEARVWLHLGRDTNAAAFKSKKLPKLTCHIFGRVALDVLRYIVHTIKNQYTVYALWTLQLYVHLHAKMMENV